MAAQCVSQNRCVLCFQADAVRLAVSEHKLSEELYDLEEENEGLVETIAGLEDRVEELQWEKVSNGCFYRLKVGLSLKYNVQKLTRGPHQPLLLKQCCQKHLSRCDEYKTWTRMVPATHHPMWLFAYKIITSS